MECYVAELAVNNRHACMNTLLVMYNAHTIHHSDIGFLNVQYLGLLRLKLVLT